MTLTLDLLNRCSLDDFTQALTGVYEHSSWIARRAAAKRPFASLAALKHAMQEVVRTATEEEQLSLIRAHPELAGKAAMGGELTRESSGEQNKAGLAHCSPEEFMALQQLNGEYNGKFGFPFILAVRGPDGRGLARQEIINTMRRRLLQQRADEIAENLRQIGRIAELRLNDLLGHQPLLGLAVLDWCNELAAFSDDPAGLTCTYMTAAHRAVAARIADLMRAAGMEVRIDAVGNVIGRYRSDMPQAKTLITGSHYDTVRNAGKYDGRLGILLPVALVRELRERGDRLPFHLEVIAFAEEEGVRFRSTFLGSNAVAGHFDMTALDRCDDAGISMRTALQQAGHEVSHIPHLGHQPEDVLGYVEVHIEQGPVLLQHDLPIGIVSAIAGSCRYKIELTGTAGHAGTTPMHMRRDAAAAAAEIILYVEQRCRQIPALVGTVGQLQVPDGSVNVIPGRCRLSLDIRAADDGIRDAAVHDILQQVDAICTRRGIAADIEPLLQMAAVLCAPRLKQQLAAAATCNGLPVFELPSGAGHDAMAMATLTDVAMLFVRCGNGGISHNPLETMTADDAEVAAQVLLDFLRHFQPWNQQHGAARPGAARK